MGRRFIINAVSDSIQASVMTSVVSGKISAKWLYAKLTATKGTVSTATPKLVA
jgi:hypothetical protein